MPASPERRHDSLGVLLFETARQLLAVGAADDLDEARLEVSEIKLPNSAIGQANRVLAQWFGQIGGDEQRRDARFEPAARDAAVRPGLQREHATRRADPVPT